MAQYSASSIDAELYTGGTEKRLLKSSLHSAWLFRGYLYLLCIATICAAIFTVWPRLFPTTYDGKNTIPTWGELEPQLITTPQRQKIPGYKRERFGRGWGNQGVCSTRESVLLAGATNSPQLPAPVTQEACEIANIEIWDEYAGESITIAESAQHVDIDHIFPLSAAWDLGAHSWTEERRKEFANDGRNLVATASSANRENRMHCQRNGCLPIHQLIAGTHAESLWLLRAIGWHSRNKIYNRCALHAAFFTAWSSAKALVKSHEELFVRRLNLST